MDDNITVSILISDKSVMDQYIITYIGDYHKDIDTFRFDYIEFGYENGKESIFIDIDAFHE